MPTFREGDRVQVARRKVTEADRKNNRYFDHMAGLTGQVQSVYADGIAVKVDPDSMSDVTRRVQLDATRRMREKFLANVSDEQKKNLTKEEMEFDANYVVLVQPADLEAV